MPLTSIIIPTYNHAAFLAEAIESALAQTAEVEVLVVDDGSTDETRAVLDVFEDTLGPEDFRAYHQTHQGPSAARNLGIEQAHGEFVMFLDADDVIAPNKVEQQLREFSDDVGWVLCDVRIEDAVRGRVELASERYRYAERQLGGWIREQLAGSNFIPIMAPLVRRSVLEAVRFGELLPEDWHFWYAVAALARVRYVPRVLATYRKRRSGRNATRQGQAHVSPESYGEPLVLNLGCGTPGTRSWHPMPGCVNLDRALGWYFEDGLPQYGPSSVDAITISHALMYLAERDWAAFLADCWRVLKPGGVLRITEDDTANPASDRLGGWRGSEPAVTLTSPTFVCMCLERAGFVVHVDLDAATTTYRDTTLLQAQHGALPDVFFVEAVKP